MAIALQTSCIHRAPSIDVIQTGNAVFVHKNWPLAMRQEIIIAMGMREGAFLGSGLAISTTGVETTREREQNARKDALTVVTRRVCMRYESHYRPGNSWIQFSWGLVLDGAIAGGR